MPASRRSTRPRPRRATIPNWTPCCCGCTPKPPAAAAGPWPTSPRPRCRAVSGLPAGEGADRAVATGLARLMGHLQRHVDQRGAPPDGQLLRYRDGRPISTRRYDQLWKRIGRQNRAQGMQGTVGWGGRARTDRCGSPRRYLAVLVDVGGSEVAGGRPVRPGCPAKAPVIRARPGRRPVARCRAGTADRQRVRRAGVGEHQDHGLAGWSAACTVRKRRGSPPESVGAARP